jgi:hypothetical protein
MKINTYISNFFDELPTRLFLMLFMFSNDPGYGNGAWYKSLGPRKQTDTELENAKFNPDNYRTQTFDKVQTFNEAYKKLIEIRNIEAK